MQLKRVETKLKPAFKLAQDPLDLRTLSTDVIINHLEYSRNLREMPLQDRLKKNVSVCLRSPSPS
ncbi:hypothetical protein HY641_01980 [Candidatus Woesearchaeota archaeon]|nr:hypothetical protein [Candidatus Woesearchaeota archaeon]